MCGTGGRSFLSCPARLRLDSMNTKPDDSVDIESDQSVDIDCAEQESRSTNTSYFYLSRQPLHVLLFLTPFLVAYELGAMVYLSAHDGNQAQQIAAWGMLARTFASLGVVGYHLPAILLVTVLLIWHLLERDPWTIRLPVLVGMAMEACVLTVPLTIMAMLIAGSSSEPAAAVLGWFQHGSGVEAAQGVPSASVDNIAALSEGARLTIAIGAGLYEELLFRMLLIAAVHAVLVDVMKLPNWLGSVLAVVAAAAAFALYHHVPGSGGSPQTTSNMVFFFVAGLYFGAIYLIRGFGLVVGVHALYDMLALMVIGSSVGS